jgi:hypothetical protein
MAELTGMEAMLEVTRNACIRSAAPLPDDLHTGHTAPRLASQRGFSDPDHASRFIEAGAFPADWSTGEGQRHVN